MGRNTGDGDGLNPSSEKSSPLLNSSGKRRSCRDGEQHSRKRKKIKTVSSETEASMSIQTLTPGLSGALTSCTRRNSTYHDFTHHRREEKKRRRKPCRVHCQRNWTYSSARDASNYNDRIVIVSYNILGVENAKKHPELYSGVSPKYLEWGYRKKLLCKEVKSYQPSIMCFQEVDRFAELSKILGKDGFRGLHKARSGDAHDGCSIFWKADLFTLLHEENVEFQRFGLRNNVAQFCILKMNQNHPQVSSSVSHSSTSRCLLIGNIHILYNPKLGDIKLGQLRIFLEKAYELSQTWGGIPVALTGDLNSLPQSAMYQFLASSKLRVQEHDRRHISGQILPSVCSGFFSQSRWNDEELQLATGSRRGTLRHRLKLSSAYAGISENSNVRDQHGEPLVTSYHSMFAGTVDYIWHTQDLVPIKVVETLPMHKLKKTGGLPSKEWGSDHLALVCEFGFADETD